MHAQTKVYQYDGDLPFVQMMLNMMATMGILDRLPNHLAYKNNGSSNHRQTPWSGNNLDSMWGDPSWGVLPSESYTQQYSPYSAPSSSDDLSGWVNESWETSRWNSNAENIRRPVVRRQESAPAVRNFNYNAGDNNQSSFEKNPRQNHASRNADLPPNKQPTISKNEPRQSPCVTQFCGLKKPSLNGLWVAKNGEMLGVKNHRYLWSDSKSRYLTGLLKVQNSFLLANVDGHEQLMRFKYKLMGNRLTTVQANGEVREFTLLSPEQYRGAFRNKKHRNYYQ